MARQLGRDDGGTPYAYAKEIRTGIDRLENLLSPGLVDAVRRQGPAAEFAISGPRQTVWNRVLSLIEARKYLDQ